MCDILCTFQINLMQSPRSSVQELNSFMFSLWCMTNPCIIFSGTCCCTAHPRRGRMGTGCCVACSELSSARSSCFCSLCSGWNRHIVLAQVLVEASVRPPQHDTDVGALTVCSFHTRDSGGAARISALCDRGQDSGNGWRWGRAGVG